jgi:acyl-CoA synthetase (AMP-forming)/AMP-acid ligase II
MTSIRRKSSSGPLPLPHGISAGAVLSPELLTRWQERFGAEFPASIGTIEILLIFISQ